MQGLSSYWQDNNKEDGETRQVNRSKSQWLSFSSRLWLIITQKSETKWFSWKMSVFLKPSDQRPGPNVRFSPGKPLHSTRCKTIQIQFLTVKGTFSQSLLHHRVLDLHRGVPMFRLNVQMSSVTHNPSKTTWQKQHNRQRRTFFAVPETSLSPSSLHRTWLCF